MTAAEVATAAEPRVALVQDGARGHYRLALALQKAGLLEVMYTDMFVRQRSLTKVVLPLLAKLAGGPVRRMLDRQCPELDGRRVRTNLLMRMRQDKQRKNFPTKEDFFAWQSGDTAQWIQKKGLRRANAVMGFVRNIDPDLCARYRAAGLKTVGDQMIAPAVMEQLELGIQHQRFPGWQQAEKCNYPAVIQYEARTWEHLDAITCPSDYVRACMVVHGVPADKAVVINYPIDDNAFTPVDRRGRKGPLTVGFVGGIGLRKGAPYFFQVAERFSPDRVKFVMLGGAQLDEKKLNENKGAVEIIPHAPRSEVAQWLARFDLIYFPTTCEGSAYALMEAMATGLPIVTSPNSGTVARHAKEGYLCPYSDIDAASTYIEKLVQDEELRLEMGLSAAARYREFDLANYVRQLQTIFRRLLGA